MQKPLVNKNLIKFVGIDIYCVCRGVSKEASIRYADERFLIKFRSKLIER